jgi:hypothetical protein
MVGRWLGSADSGQKQGQILVNAAMYLRVPYNTGRSWLPEQLQASHEELYAVSEWVTYSKLLTFYSFPLLLAIA